MLEINKQIKKNILVQTWYGMIIGEFHGPTINNYLRYLKIFNINQTSSQCAHYNV